MPQPIENIGLSFYENKIRLEWEMPVENKQFVWEHDQMEVRLYCQPDLILSEGQFGADLESHHRASGAEASIGVNLAVFQATFGGSREVIRKVFRAGAKQRNQRTKQYYNPIYWDFTTALPQNNDSVILYTDWQIKDTSWLEKAFLLKAVFGVTNEMKEEEENKFEILYEKRLYHDAVDTKLIELSKQMSPYLRWLKNTSHDSAPFTCLKS